MPTEDPTAKRRPRVSLLSLLLLTGLIASWLTTAMLWREVGPLRAEVRKLREDAGILTIGDPGLVHSVGVKTYQEHAFRWRIWVPANRRFAVYVATSAIPETGTTKHVGRLEINRRNQRGAKVEVTLSADKQLDGKPRWNLREDSITKYLPVPEEASKWLTEGASGWEGGSRTFNQAEERGKPLVLARQRVNYNRGQILPPANPQTTTDGLLVWVDEIE